MGQHDPHCVCAASGVTQSNHWHPIKGSFVVITGNCELPIFYDCIKLISKFLCSHICHIPLELSIFKFTIVSTVEYLNTPWCGQSTKQCSKMIDISINFTMSPILMTYALNASV